MESKKLAESLVPALEKLQQSVLGLGQAGDTVGIQVVGRRGLCTVLGLPTGWGRGHSSGTGIWERPTRVLQAGSDPGSDPRGPLSSVLPV